MYTINGLQSVCDVLFENPSWSIAHLVAFFNLKEYLSHPKLVESIDSEDFATHMTPIQVSFSQTPHHQLNVSMLAQHLHKIINDVCALVTKTEFINIIVLVVGDAYRETHRKTITNNFWNCTILRGNSNWHCTRFCAVFPWKHIPSIQWLFDVNYY